MRIALPYQDEAVRLRIRQRSKHDSLDNAEHSGGGANSQSEREHGNRGEAGVLHQHAKSKADVLPEMLGPECSPGFIETLTRPGYVTEGKQRGPAGFLLSKALVD